MMRLFLLFFLLSALEAGAQTLIPADPGALSPRLVFRSQGQRESRVVQDGEKFLRLEWDPAQKNYCEIQLGRNAVPLPKFHSAEIEVTVWIPEGANVGSVNLRLVDREGEIFQFSRRISADMTGRQILSYEISPQTALRSWGKKKNGILDFPLRLFGFAAESRGRTGDSTILIGQVKLALLEAPVQLTLETGTPCYVVRPGEEGKLGLRITNPNLSAFRGRLHYRIRDIGQQTLAEEDRAVEVPPQQSLFLPLPKPERYGVYYLTPHFSGKNAETEPEMRYCSMLPAGPAEGNAETFLFGVCSHTERYPAGLQEKEIAAAALCGAKVMRLSFDWKRIQRGRGHWDFAFLDRILKLLEANHMEMQGIYLGMPDWARAREWKPVRHSSRTSYGSEARPDYKMWAEYVRGVAAHVRGRVRYVEIWNEPDLLSFANFSAEEYIEILKIAYQEIKQIAPEMTVLTGGFTNLRVPAERSSDPEHFRKTLTRARGFYDVVAFHAHGSFAYYQPQVDGLVRLFRELGVTVPWYANETAVSAVGTGEKEQAFTLFRKFLYSWANGAIGYNWYCLRNKGKNPGNNEHNFGLLTEDFQPKAAYLLYNMLATHYRGATFLKAYRFGKNACGLLFRSRQGDYLLGCWSDRLPLPILVSGLTGTVTRIDAWGNESVLRPDGKNLLFAATEEPQSFRFPGTGGEPQLHTDFLQTGNSDLLLPPGRSRVFRFVFHNPTEVPLVLPLKVVASAGLSVGKHPDGIPLKAGESRTVELALTATRNFRSYYGQSRGLQFQIRSAELFFPIQSMFEVRGQNFDREPDFQLNDAAQLTSFAINEPQTAHLFWRGPEDLSAAIYLGEDGENLLLKVRVTDDHHHQPYEEAQIWKGDSVQFALNLPGQGTFWEFGLARLNSGENRVWVWRAPAAFQAETVAKAIQLKTVRNETAKRTDYLARIPFAAIGLTPELQKKGIRFNLLVNDNDGEMRESYLAITPGLGTEKRVRFYPHLLITGEAPERLKR